MRLDPLQELLALWKLCTASERTRFLGAIAAPARPLPPAGEGHDADQHRAEDGVPVDGRRSIGLDDLRGFEGLKAPGKEKGRR